MLTELVVWLNGIAGAASTVALAPMARLPIGLTLTLIAIVTGVVMLFIFKHTSNQAAIKQTRNQIKANLLALSLFKDDIQVGLKSQGRLILAGCRLLLFSLVPMLVMLIPTCLLLGQLSLWYQVRPLSTGEEALVTVHLAHVGGSALPDVQLLASSAISSSVGPVRVPSRQMICWNVLATESGCHQMSFEVEGKTYTKELAVGTGFMPTSQKRPERSLGEVLLHPREQPFSRDSPIQSIEVKYPVRLSWISGSHTWLWYWLAISMVAAFAARPLLNVNI